MIEPLPRKGGESVRDTAERRMLILDRLCERRHDFIKHLADEFHVTYRTIQTDLQVLSCSYPIYISRGTPGGIYVMDGYHLGMKYLTDEQCELLEKLSETLNGEDAALLKEILKTFRKPA